MIAALRITAGIVSIFGWLVALLVVNPLLFQFGDLHNWHGTDDPEWIDQSVTIIACCGIAFSIAVALGAPRWMLWPCLVLTLLIALAAAAPAVPNFIRALHYYGQHADLVRRGRFFQLWTYLGGALAICFSAISYSLLCFLSYRRRTA